MHPGATPPHTLAPPLLMEDEKPSRILLSARVEYALDNYLTLHFDCYCSLGWWYYRLSKTQYPSLVYRAMYDNASVRASKNHKFKNMNKSNVKNYPDDLTIFQK